MVASKRFAAILVCAGLAASTYGQARTDFDSLTEGFVGPTLVTPAGTFLDLQLDTLGTPGNFAIENASGLLSAEARFSTPNVLGFGSFAPGNSVLTTPVSSFRVLLTHPASAIRLGLFLDITSPFNFILVEFYSGGVAGATWAGSSSQYHVFDVSECDNPGPYDEIRVRGMGTVDGGRFRGMLDTLVIANAPCDSAPTACAAGPLTACPCGNTPTSTTPMGCINSSGTLGGVLGAGGIASLTVDEVQVNAVFLPVLTSGLLAASNTLTTGAVFGDGYSCLGPAPQRIAVRLANGAGLWSYYPTTGPRFSVAAGMVAGTPRSFQLFYRDNAAFCTSATYNVTNAFTLTYAP